MLARQLSYSYMQHLKLRSFNSQFSKVKPSCNEYELENEYEIKKASSISIRIFRRKNDIFIVR